MSWTDENEKIPIVEAHPEMLARPVYREPIDGTVRFPVDQQSLNEIRKIVREEVQRALHGSMTINEMRERRGLPPVEASGICNHSIYDADGNEIARAKGLPLEPDAKTLLKELRDILETEYSQGGELYGQYLYKAFYLAENAFQKLTV